MFTLKLQPSVCKLEAVVSFYPIDKLLILWYIGYVMLGYNYIHRNFGMIALVAFLVIIISYGIAIRITQNDNPCNLYNEEWQCYNGECGCYPIEDDFEPYLPYPKEY